MIQQMTRLVQGGLRQEKKYEMIANHIANASTSGFKADILSFNDVLQSKLSTDFTPGNIRATGNPLDLAIAEDGFFAVQTANGVRYTRDGNLTVNSQSELVTQNGDPVLSSGGGNIIINGTEVNISSDGTIDVDGANIGALKVVTFESMDKLKKEGNSLFVYTGGDNEEIIPDNINVKQHALESANIQTVTEMTKMVETFRMYESYQKLIQSLDEIEQKAVDIGKPI